jgi:hypothetical protein
MDADQFSRKEAERRLQKALRRAFAGPPTALKDISKRNGGSRAAKPIKKPKGAK